MTPKLVEQGKGTTVNVIGNAITIRIHDRDTGGALCVIESDDKPGEGPPPHIHHREAETFQVLEGEYEFACDGQKFKAKKGDTIFAPAGLPHNYRNIGNTLVG